MSDQKFKKARRVSGRPKNTQVKLQKIPQATSYNNNQKLFQGVSDIPNDPAEIFPNDQQQYHGNSQKKLNRDQIQTNFPQNNVIVNSAETKQILRNPYQFLKRNNAPFHTILFPHFTWKSINFFISLTMVILFIILISMCYSQKQTDITWSCTLFKLQNKFYPRLRYNYQFWRILVSPFFHSNISHIVLNLIGIQVYGYFIQWYYGKLRYIISIILAMIYSHFLSCLTNQVSVSTTASSILYSFLAMKILFFVRYKNYNLLSGKKTPLYGLLGLIFAMNMIVLFIGSNVDYGSHIAGFIAGGLCGIMFYPFKYESRITKAVRIITGILVVCIGAGLIVACFTKNLQFYLQLNRAIDSLC